MKYHLYHAPTACSSVVLNALEEARLSYRLSIVDVRLGCLRKAEYLAINPDGKVPALVVDGHVLTENPAILTFLASEAPMARLLPCVSGAFAQARSLAELVWCASTLHPIVRQLRMPGRYIDGDEAGVRANGMLAFKSIAQRLEARLSVGAWWHGGDWSIADNYVHWCYTTAARGGFDLTEYASLWHHAEKLTARDAFTRASIREAEALKQFDFEQV